MMIEVRTYGDSGPPVVVVHGGPGAAGHMAPVARELAATGFRVFEPLQRRSGGVPLTVARHIGDLREVVEQLCPGSRTAVVGTSWGAMLALATAAEFPDLFSAIVLIGSGTYDDVSRRRFHELIAERTPPEVTQALDRAEAAGDDAALAEAARGLIGPYSYDLVTDDLEDVWIDARGNRETMEDWHRRRESGEYLAAFAAIRAPVLMVHGDTDPHPGVLIRDSLLPVIPQLEYVELARCGHYPWFERHARDTFFRVLRGWLERQPSRTISGTRA